MKKPFTVIAIVLLSLSVPVWASGIAFVVAAGLAVMVWLEMRK